MKKKKRRGRERDEIQIEGNVLLTHKLEKGRSKNRKKQIRKSPMTKE